MGTLKIYSGNFPIFDDVNYTHISVWIGVVGSALKGSYYDLVTHTFIECGYGLGYNYTNEIFRENGYHLYQMVVKEVLWIYCHTEMFLYH